MLCKNIKYAPLRKCTKASIKDSWQGRHVCKSKINVLLKTCTIEWYMYKLYYILEVINVLTLQFTSTHTSPKTLHTIQSRMHVIFPDEDVVEPLPFGKTSWRTVHKLPR